MITGDKTQFIQEVKKGDYIYLINSNIQITLPQGLTTNPRINIDLNQLCLVESIYDDSIMKTEQMCLWDKKRPGAFILISYNLRKDNSNSTNNLDVRELNLNSNTSISKNRIESLFTSHFDYFTFSEFNVNNKLKNYYLVSSVVDKRLNDYNEFSYNKISKIMNSAVKDKNNIFTSNNFNLREDILNLAKENKPDDNKNNSNDIFHKGYLIEDTGIAVYSDKLVSQKPYLKHESMYFVKEEKEFSISFTLKNLDNYFSTFSMIIETNSNLINSDNDADGEKYQLLIDSRFGVILKQLKNNNDISNKDAKIVDYFSSDMKYFFNEKTNIRILVLNNTLYVLQSESLNESNKFSVKIKYSLPKHHYIKSFLFDIDNTTTISVSELIKRNYVNYDDLFAILEDNIKNSLDKNVSFTEYFSKGDICAANGKPRKTIVEYRCNIHDISDAYVEEVNEESICVYKLFVKSRHLCNPLEKRKITNSNTSIKTECDVLY